jgi:hypothetical protein
MYGTYAWATDLAGFIDLPDLPPILTDIPDQETEYDVTTFPPHDLSELGNPSEPDKSTVPA